MDAKLMGIKLKSLDNLPSNTRNVTENANINITEEPVRRPKRETLVIQEPAANKIQQELAEKANCPSLKYALKSSSYHYIVTMVIMSISSNYLLVAAWKVHALEAGMVASADQ